MSKEKVVIVGAGGIFGAWAPHISREGLEVAAIVDLRLEAAQKRKEEMGWDCKVSTDLDTILKNVKPDFVIDLTVPDAHCEVTCKALRAGAHVIGEKPMANSMEEARLMVKTSEETGRLYMVSQSRRWDAKHILCQKVVQERRLGSLTTINCDFYIGAHFGGFRAEMESPLILDMAIHHFDLARMITGENPIAVYCYEHNPVGSWYRGAAAASCIFEMTNGVVFNYTGSWCAEGFQTSWNGDWYLTFVGGGLEYIRDQVPKICYPDQSQPAFIYKRIEEVLEVPSIELTGMGGALAEMLRFIRYGEKPQTECHDNIHSLAMVFAAMESSRRQSRVVVQV